MDIEAFYEQNEARRESAEFEFGSEWTDSADNEYELSWVEATGELYLMVEPDAVVTEDMFGDFLMSDEPVNDLTVVVIGEDSLLGWPGRPVGRVGRSDARRELTHLALRAPAADLRAQIRGRGVGHLAESCERGHEIRRAERARLR